jgi:hypothetical protein
MMAGRLPAGRTSESERDEGFVVDARGGRDLPRTERASIRVPSRRERSGDARPAESDVAIRTEMSRIGRRGPLRPELVALLLGAAFVAAALIKPWPNPPRVAISPTPSALADASRQGDSGITPEPSAAPTIDVYALIPPYNYRPGQWPPPTQGPTPAADTPWSHVDWSFLSVADAHDRWGVSAVALPGRAPADGRPDPSVSWAAEIAPWSPSIVPVPRDSSVFALALTWPAGLRVSSLSIDYLGAIDTGPTVDMPVVAPAARVEPLSAIAVATPPGTSPPAAASLAPPDGLVSGSYWIPPSSDLSGPSPEHVQAAWQRSPWSWPLGMYRATLASNAGTMIVVLQLVAA